MNRYYAVFRVPVSNMDEWMKTTTPEARKEQMDKMMSDWSAWAEAIKASIVDAGSPLGKTKTVTTAGVADTRNDLNFLMMVQAESHDAAADLFKTSPHLSIPGSSVDVMEIPHYSA